MSVSAFKCRSIDVLISNKIANRSCLDLRNFSIFHYSSNVIVSENSADYEYDVYFSYKYKYD